MKWWGILLLILLICGVGVGAFFLGSSSFFMDKGAEKAQEAAVDSATAQASEAKKEEKGDKEEKGEEKADLPTLPRLKRYLRPVKSSDLFSQRYAMANVKPHWHGQTAYGPPLDMRERLFSKDILLGRKKMSMPNRKVYMADDRKMKSTFFQVEIARFRYYKQAKIRMSALSAKITDPLVICDILDERGRVVYALRIQRPMTKGEAQDYIAYCLEVTDVIPKVVRYAF